MSQRYGCVCFALPGKLLKHLADKSSGAERELLHAQVHHSATLRARRAVLSKHRPGPKPGRQLLHRQVFDAQGQTFLPGTLLRDEDDPPSRDKEADDAYQNIGIALQFYKSVLGRDSVDGAGMRIDTTVHYGFRFANAMWTGEQMIVGDGDGQHVKGLARSLGLIAHELSHGITQHIVSGGLGVVSYRARPPRSRARPGP
jgi:Zn-dependent metalloprotease